MIRIIMHGCNGKMGQVITTLISKDTTAEIVAGIDPHDNIKNTYPVYTNINDCNVAADVIIDFSNAVAIPSLLDYAISKNMPVVVCTTGLNNIQIDKVKNASKKIPVLFSANMSLGINLIINLVQKATAVLTDANFDIEIVEKHHNQKLDAPSGTALAIADSINDVLDNRYLYKFDRSVERIKRNKKEIGIHAVRGGTIVGEHSIIFAGQDEIIELNHMALSKDIFAVGSINAAKFLSGKEIGMYDMSHVING